MFLIISKKRSLTNVMFWKQSQFGYTDCLGEAGKFSYDQLLKINLEDGDSIPVNIGLRPNILGITVTDVLNACYFRNSHIKVVLLVESDVFGRRMFDIVNDLEFNGKLEE